MNFAHKKVTEQILLALEPALLAQLSSLLAVSRHLLVLKSICLQVMIFDSPKHDNAQQHFRHIRRLLTAGSNDILYEIGLSKKE
jgi:hypothetical protein